MMKKLRTFLVALLLVPALVSTAGAFTTENDGSFNPARPPSAICWIKISGMWFPVNC